MPAQAMVNRTALSQFSSHERMQIVHRVRMGGRRVSPFMAQHFQTTLHFTQNPLRLLQQPFRRHVLVGHNALYIVVGRFGDFAAACDHKGGFFNIGFRSHRQLAGERGGATRP